MQRWRWSPATGPPHSGWWPASRRRCPPPPWFPPIPGCRPPQRWPEARATPNAISSWRIPLLQVLCHDGLVTKAWSYRYGWVTSAVFRRAGSSHEGSRLPNLGHGLPSRAGVHPARGTIMTSRVLLLCSVLFASACGNSWIGQTSEAREQSRLEAIDVSTVPRGTLTLPERGPVDQVRRDRRQRPRLAAPA